MSSVARWSYTNVATVWPRTAGQGGWKGNEAVHGEPYTIKCTWKVGAELVRGQDSKEFLAKCKFWHEDKRVKLGDRIAKGDHSGLTWQEAKADEIKAHDEDDVSMFGGSDAQFPDFTSVV